MSTKTRIVLASSIIFLFCVGSSLIIFSAARNAEHIRLARRERKERRNDKVFGNEMLKMHIMSMDDGAKFRQITRGVINTHAISDDDLDWMLAILKTPITQYDDGSASSTARPIMAKMVTLGTLRLVKESTPQQQDKVFVALAPLLFGSDDINKAEADRTLVAFKVTKAIPDIQPQLKDPNAGVRRVAKAALKALKA